MKDLAHLVEQITNGRTAEETFAHYTSFMSGYGYERVIYSLLTDHPSLSLKKQHGLATSYPEHWLKYYNEKNYLKIDPVVIGIEKSRTPFFWDDLQHDPDIPKSSFKIIEQGAEAGVKNGIGITLFGQTGELVGIGLARKDDEKGKDFQFLANAYLLSVFFHEKYRSLLRSPLPSMITAKEKDVLSWAAEGKTDEEIAKILNLSVHTVRWHWKKLFVKLEANGRLYCITKAIMLGLIAPNRISATPY